MPLSTHEQKIISDILERENDLETSGHLHLYVMWLKDLQTERPELHSRALHLAEKFDELIDLLDGLIA